MAMDTKKTENEKKKVKEEELSIFNDELFAVVKLGCGSYITLN